MIGAAILSIPVGFTEETWNLGATLPLLFIATFVYYNYHRDENSPGAFEFAKRVLSTYALSLLVVAVILTLIENGKKNPTLATIQRLAGALGVSADELLK